MFVGFFYLLRQRGFGVSLNEWMTLMEGLLLGLHRSTLTGFYDLCRAVLVKSEADYDKFDAAFLEYFKDVPFPEELLPDELMDWLNHPKNALEEFRAFLREQGYAEKSIDEILKMFEERLKEQKEEHNGGSYWIGTGGYSNFGNAGHSPQGIRVGGESIYRRAFQVAGERKYRDFRRDNTLDIRQFHQVGLSFLFGNVKAFGLCQRHQIVGSFALHGFFNLFFCEFIFVDWHVESPIITQIKNPRQFSFIIIDIDE